MEFGTALTVSGHDLFHHTYFSPPLILHQPINTVFIRKKEQQELFDVYFLYSSLIKDIVRLDFDPEILVLSDVLSDAGNKSLSK